MTHHDDRHPTELLSAYADGELSGSELASVTTHLAECSSCRLLLEELERLAAAIANEPVPAVPEGLTRRVADAIEADS
ncbi:MAG: zf-HC2 domain-containing protein, partial [Acidobacteriota bacterium]